MFWNANTDDAVAGEASAREAAAGEVQAGAVSAPVNRILRSSIVDGPGNRAAVFVQGCNFNCPYCHNPETIALCSACGICIDRCRTGALSLGEGRILWRREQCILCDECIKACPHNASPRVRIMNPQEVMAEIEPSLLFIRGITVSGGECTLYPGFLRELGKRSREKGKTFFLDSNGSFDFSSGGELLTLCDGVMLDVKAAPADAERVAGRPGFDPLPQAEFLARAGKLYEMRTVVSCVKNAEGIFDNDRNLPFFDAAALVEEACRRIAPIDRNVRYKLIRFRPNGVRPEAAAALTTPPDSLMETLAGICADYGIASETV